MIFSLQKFQHYLLSNQFIFYTNHQVIKYLVNKPFHHRKKFRLLLLFQEFEFEVIVWPRHANVRPNYFLRVQTSEETIGIDDELLETHLFIVETVPKEMVDIVQFLEDGKQQMDYQKKE